MPGPAFPLPPSIEHDCCDRAECGGGESSQWHWLSWHWAFRLKKNKISTRKEYVIWAKASSVCLCVVFFSISCVYVWGDSTHDKSFLSNHQTGSFCFLFSPHALVRLHLIYVKRISAILLSYRYDTLTRWTATSATSAWTIACWGWWFTLRYCVDWHCVTLCISTWWSTPIYRRCTPIAPGHHNFLFFRIISQISIFFFFVVFVFLRRIHFFPTFILYTFS